MTKSTPHPEVTQAYKLLKAGKRKSAGRMLRTYLAEHTDDADAWWLMSHIVTTEELTKKALLTALSIDPTHDRARTSLRKMGITPPSVTAHVQQPAVEDASEDVPEAVPEDVPGAAPLNDAQPLPWQQAPQPGDPGESSAAPQTATDAGDVFSAAAFAPAQTDSAAEDSEPDDPPAWTAPAALTDIEPDAPDAEANVLDEEPDDSMFFTPTPPRRESSGRSKIVQPLNASPPAPASSLPSPTVGSAAVTGGGSFIASSNDDGDDDDAFDDTFDMDFDAPDTTPGIPPPPPPPDGTSFEAFALTNTVDYDPFSGEPVHNPFAEIPQTDDPFDGPDAVVAALSKRTAPDEPPTATRRTTGDTVLTLSVVGFSVLVMVFLALFVLDERGSIDMDIFSAAGGAKTLETARFELEYPSGYDMRCRTERFGYDVCGIVRDAVFNEVDQFVDPNSPQTAGVMAPGLSIIVMDVPESSPAYQGSSWAKSFYTLYEQNDYVDPDARVTYNGREDIRVDGHTAYYYEYTNEGLWHEAAWDLYIPHDGTVFWLRATFFGMDDERIPQHVIDDIIDSIEIK